MENWKKICGYCKYFRPIPDSDLDGVATRGNCLIDPEVMEEAFHFDDSVCGDWKLSERFRQLDL